MVSVNKVAGFWIKFIARITDLVIIALLIVGTAFGIMQRSAYGPKGTVIWHFVEPWTFYVWAIFAIVVLAIAFILIPTIWKGKSIGMFIFRINVIQTKKQPWWNSISKREAIFAMMWILNVILLMAFINHTLINEYARTKHNGDDFKAHWAALGGWERMRIEVVTTIGTLTLVIQMLFAISSVVRKDKTGFADIYAGTRVVYINKYVEEEKKKTSNVSKSIKPKLIHNTSVDWVK